jgi:hypothetical protein
MLQPFLPGWSEMPALARARIYKRPSEIGRVYGATTTTVPSSCLLPSSADAFNADKICWTSHKTAVWQPCVLPIPA